MVSLTAGVVSPAAADWVYTRWGMSEAEVLAAGHGKIARYVDPDREDWGIYPTLVGSHRDMQHSYDVAFYFDRHTGGLNAVRLSPNGHYWCLELLDGLRARYGWRNLVRDDLFEWHDPAANDKISYRLDPCWVKYEPLAPAYR